MTTTVHTSKTASGPTTTEETRGHLPGATLPEPNSDTTVLPPVLLCAADLARLLLLSEQRVYDLCRRALIPHIRLGRQVRFHPTQITAWLASGGTSLPGGWRWQPPEDLQDTEPAGSPR